MKISEKGFTIIELIVTLVLVGIISVFAGLGFTHVVEGYVFTKMNTATLQKGQMAMSRISLEIKNAKSISNVSTATAITFDSFKDSDVSTTRRIRLSGERIEIDDGEGLYRPLTDQAASGGFSLQYFANYDDTTESRPAEARLIAVTLRMEGAGGHIQQFVERITPRNM